MSESKRCSKCGEQLPVTEFFRSAVNKDGLHAWCRACNRLNAAERRRAKGVPPKPVSVPLPPGSTKECRRCHRVLEVSNFYRSTQNIDGWHSYCKACDTERVMAWHAANPERTSEINRACYQRKKQRKAER